MDSLVTGHLQSVHPKAKFFLGDVRNRKDLVTVFQENKIDAVVHFAAFIEVGESVSNPLKYFDNNSAGMITLLEVMRDFKVGRLVFSSTAAVYGEPRNIPILEDDPKEPTSPYGESKLTVEKILKWSDRAYGIKYVALRYFNAAGATPVHGEDHHPETHLIPLVMQAAEGKRPKISVFGTDYDTPDGTCIRDYIHVLDLAQAHLLALENQDSGAFNLGTGQGHSVKSIIDTVKKVTGLDFPVEYAERRPGDPARLIADSTAAKTVLGWKPQYDDINAIVESAWKWRRLYPNGYQD
jgi:UDP-glucose 4-epimerase